MTINPFIYVAEIYWMKSIANIGTLVVVILQLRLRTEGAFRKAGSFFRYVVLKDLEIHEKSINCRR